MKVFFKFLKVVKSKPRSLFCLQILCLSSSNSSVSSSSAVSNHPGLFSPFVFVFILLRSTSLTRSHSMIGFISELKLALS